MKTKLNQVAIFSLANCERILTNNTDKSLCLKNFGEDLIRQVRKDDWSEKTTLKIREYLDNCYTSVNTMRESRRPFTSRLGEIHKRFVAQENAIDPEKPGTPAFVCKQILAERLRLEDERIADERSRNERARLRAIERIERDGKLTDEARAEAIERNNLRYAKRARKIDDATPEIELVPRPTTREGYVELFKFWWQEVGQGLTEAELERVFHPMLMFAKRQARKNILIDNELVAYDRQPILRKKKLA